MPGKAQRAWRRAVGSSSDESKPVFPGATPEDIPAHAAGTKKERRPLSNLTLANLTTKLKPGRKSIMDMEWGPAKETGAKTQAAASGGLFQETVASEQSTGALLQENVPSEQLVE